MIGVLTIGIHRFFTSLNDLERIFRAPGRFKFEEHNVAAHSWKVAQYALFFGTLEEMHGAKVNWKSLYEKTINHDFAEVFIGDDMIATLTLDDEDGEVCYQLQMAILDIDLDEV